MQKLFNFLYPEDSFCDGLNIINVSTNKRSLYGDPVVKFSLTYNDEVIAVVTKNSFTGRILKQITNYALWRDFVSSVGSEDKIDDYIGNFLATHSLYSGISSNHNSNAFIYIGAHKELLHVNKDFSSIEFKRWFERNKQDGWVVLNEYV